jgi:hypothetical protein
VMGTWSIEFEVCTVSIEGIENIEFPVWRKVHSTVMGMWSIEMGILN